MTEVFVVDGARTAFGSFGGGLKDATAHQLGVTTAKGAMERSGLDASKVDNVVMGNVIQAHEGAPYLARHVALDSGVPIETPALTLNRLCGSGLQAVVSATQSIKLGESEVGLAGGAENMSQAPYVSRKARFGIRMGNDMLVDTLSEALTDNRAGCGMGTTAENLAERYGITREDQDAFAARSHQSATQATESGRLAEEIVPVTVKSRKGPVEITRDEHIREGVDQEALSNLRPAFKRDGGTVTAGNSSGINDGAAMLVVASENAVNEESLEPMGRVVSWAVTGVDPNIMGIGPVPASRLALKRAGLSTDDLDLIEINEAFAAQYLACEEELGLDREKVNVNGGAVAFGHPVGASGARVLLTLLYELKRRDKKYGLASLCIGGGQGIAMVVEAV
ncbi:MAG TPA: acetyl-CoA C-acetyltransferase [Rubrobacteraceae bacterium]|nr:acetyl-CoA C-acetyltransferase [Rubrobacteraceae bacterium]